MSARLRLLLLLGIAAFVFAASRGAAAEPVTVSLTVDATQRLQRVDGFGVNINSNQWNGGQLAPVLDTLIDTAGVRTWRGIVESFQDWEPAEDALAPPAIDSSIYRGLYEGPKFQSLWAVLGYLARRNQQQVVLNVMGAVPESLGRTVIRPDAEDRWAEMIASLVAYGRQIKGLPIRVVSPLNEVDLGFPEGPRVGPEQYARLMRKLLTRLDARGQQDLQIAPPDIASPGNAAAYFAPLLSDAGLMSRVAFFSLHDYSGYAGGARALIDASPYAGRELWMTEYSAPCPGCDTGRQAADQWDFAADTVEQLIGYVEQGAASALIYDGYDSVYEHHQSIGHWGLLSYDPAGGAYAPRKRLFGAAQALRFVDPGMIHVGTTAGGDGIAAMAFIDPGGSALTIVGHNRTNQPMTIAGALTGITGVTALSVIETTPTRDLSRDADVAVQGGTFTFTVEPSSVFTATTLVGSGDSPVPVRTAPPASTGSTTPAVVGSRPVPTSAPTAAPPGRMLLGDATIRPDRDSNAAGMAEAFPYTATADGAVNTLALYLDGSSDATAVMLGLYGTGASGGPGPLLAAATITTPRADAWNMAAVPATELRAGDQYWLAVLAPAGAGTVVFRDRASGGGANQVSAQTSLTSLPESWSAGATYANGPMSAYAARVGDVDAISAPTAPTPASGPAAPPAPGTGDDRAAVAVLLGAGAGAGSLLIVAQRWRARMRARA
jgi:O-glycosyl hydrolase